MGTREKMGGDIDLRGHTIHGVGAIKDTSGASLSGAGGSTGSTGAAGATGSTGATGSAGTAYSPGTPGDWTSPPTTIAGALDALAAKVGPV